MNWDWECRHTVIAISELVYLHFQDICSGFAITPSFYQEKCGVGGDRWDWNFSKCGTLRLTASVFLLLLCLHARECCHCIIFVVMICQYEMKKTKTLQSKCYIQSILSLFLLACQCTTMALHLLVFLLLTAVLSLLTQAMVETVNNLLQPRAQAAWRELPTNEQQHSATLLLDTVETGAFMLADNLLKTDTVQEITDNIRKNFLKISSSFSSHLCTLLLLIIVP